MNGATTPLPDRRFVLRDLPVAARLVITCFLISVGIGYFSALVQLHFQNATPGTMLPDQESAEHAYYGFTNKSQIERLLLADEQKPFNGSGSMRSAFTTNSGGGWKRAIEKRARAKGLEKAKNVAEKKRIMTQAETDVRAEREGERLILLDWLAELKKNPKSEDLKKAYEDDNYVIPPELAKHPIDAEKYVGDDGGKKVAKIKSILDDRCVRCHGGGANRAAAQFPLMSFDEIESYTEVETTGGGMSLKKLAQSTHVHLLAFSMLYGLTGLIVAFTSYPGWFRIILGPLTLIAQLVDISCWWLGRIDPFYARVIVVSGGVVGGSLCLQIVFSLFNLWGWVGKIILVLLITAAGLGGYMLMDSVVLPYLVREGVSAVAPE
jgi:hypothetical protein